MKTRVSVVSEGEMASSNVPSGDTSDWMAHALACDGVWEGCQERVDPPSNSSISDKQG